MSDDRNRRRDLGDEVREGIKAGLGILGALKDAIEETFEDMIDRGELSQDRATEAMRTTMERAQEAFEDARARFDFVPRATFDDLAEDVKELRRRVERLENQSHEHAPETGRKDSGSTGPDIPTSEA